MEETFSESGVMAHELMQATLTAPHVAGFDVVTPLSSRTLFWRPRFLRDAASLHHLPFLFWLIDTLRPNSFVTLGGGDGVVHFAMCQAAEKLDLDARGYGFGPWQDGAGAVPADLARYNAENYPDSSRLSASEPHQGAGSFPPDSVDLLSIDMGSGAEAAAQDARVRDWIERDWSHRMSARGVLIFQGANTALEQAGADGFLASLARLHPSFHLDAGDGMLVVLRGGHPEDRLARLCRMGIGDPGYAAVLQLFSRLGSAIRAEMSARQESLRAADLQQRIEQVERDLIQSRAAAEDSRTALDKLNSAYDERNRQVAVIQGKLVDLQLGKSDHAAAQEALSAQLADAMANLAASAQREAALADQLERRTAELATLEVLRTDLETSQNKQVWLRKERERLLAEEAELRRALDVASENGQSRSAEFETQIKTLQAAVETADAEAQSRAEAIAALTQQMEQAQAASEARLHALSQDRDAQAAEAIAVLTQQLEVAQAESEARLHALSQDRDAQAAKAIAELTQQLEEAQAESEARLHALSQDRDAQAAEAIAVLTQQLEVAQAESEARLHALTQDRDAQAAEAIAVLTQQLEEAQAESEARLHALSQDRDAQAAEAQSRAEAIAVLTQNLEAAAIGLEYQRAEWEGQRDDLTRQTRALAAERDAIEADLETAQKENIALSEQRAALAMQLAAEAELAKKQCQVHEQDKAELAHHVRKVHDLTARLEASRLAEQARDHEMQAAVQTREAQIQSLKDQLAKAEAEEATNLSTLTTSFEGRQIVTDQERDNLLSELRSLREAAEQNREELLTLQAAQTEQERLFSQATALLEDDAENLRAMLRHQLTGAEQLRVVSEQHKAANAALRAERDAARAQARALDDAIARVLSSTSWKLTAPLRKLLESVRST